MEEPVEVIKLTGFDPEGEPQVRLMADGSLYVVFEFMPPSWAVESERFDDFDKQFARAIGMPVAWEDREFFRIAKPAADTVGRVQVFLASYPR